MYPVDPVTRIVCALADMPMPKGSAAAQCEAALLSCPAEPAPVHAGGTHQRKQRPEGMQRGHLAGALATLGVLIAAIPLLYLPGGVTRLVEWLRHPRRRWDRDESHWTPVPPSPGAEVRVTCRHDPGLRSMLPALAGSPPRYVTWGEGTADEMCLGILSYTRG